MVSKYLYKATPPTRLSILSVTLTGGVQAESDSLVCLLQPDQNAMANTKPHGNGLLWFKCIIEVATVSHSEL